MLLLTYSFTYLCLMSTCLVHDMAILLAINLVPTLSNITVTGCLPKISLLPQSWIMNTTSLTASGKATYPPLSWKVTHFSVTDPQETGMPSMLKHTISQDLLLLPVGSIFGPRFLVTNTYLITHRSSLNAAGLALSMVFDSSLVMLAWSRHECFTGYSSSYQRSHHYLICLMPIWLQCKH